MNSIVSLVRVIALDFKKAIFSKRLVLGILGVLIIICINLMDYIEIDPGVTVCYLFNIRGSAGGFTMCLLFLTSVPYASSFNTDYVSNNYKFEIIRSNVLRYSIGKLAATVFVAIMTHLIAYIILACLLGIFIPIFPTNKLALSVACGTQNQIFTGLLTTHFKWLYIICILLADSLMYGFLAGVALYLSTISNNPFVIFSSPIIVFYAWSSLFNTGMLPDFLGWHIFNGVFSAEKGLGFNMIFTIFYYITLIILIGIAFVKGVKRRVANG